MTTYEFDTNAGPIVKIRAANLDAAKARAVAQIPLAREAGHSVSWSRSGEWHVVHIHDDIHGCDAHQAAIRLVQRAYANGREEHEACEAGTYGCSIDHTNDRGDGCEGW